MKFISCIKAVMNKMCNVFKFNNMATVVIILLHITILTNLRAIEEYLCFRNSILISVCYTNKNFSKKMNVL